MTSQGHQDLRDVAREREFTGKMIAGIKNDIKRMLQSNFHSSSSSGRSVKNSTFSLCQLLRAGSLSYSKALPSSWVCQTNRGDLSPSRGSSVSS